MQVIADRQLNDSAKQGSKQDFPQDDVFVPGPTLAEFGTRSYKQKILRNILYAEFWPIREPKFSNVTALIGSNFQCSKIQRELRWNFVDRIGSWPHFYSTPKPNQSDCFEWVTWLFKPIWLVEFRRRVATLLRNFYMRLALSANTTQGQEAVMKVRQGAVA